MAGAGIVRDGWRSCLKCSRWVAALVLACAVATGCTVNTDVCDDADCGAGQECFDVDGAADPDHISTSIVERSNLTVRMSMRRFTRLTNGHSKKIENHGHAFALFTMHYNWCRKHATIGTSPAVKAGLADYVWTLEELIALLA